MQNHERNLKALKERTKINAKGVNPDYTSRVMQLSTSTPSYMDVLKR